MASSFTRTVGIGSWGSQLRVRVDVLNQNRSANQSHVRVRVEAYNGGNRTTYNQYPGAVVRVSGHGISYDDRVIFSIPGRSWFTFYDQNHTLGHAASGRLNLNLTGSMTDPRTGNLGDGGSITLTGSLDPLYLAPATPGAVSTAYQGDDAVRIRWSNNATARGAYDSIRVQRWDDRRGQYAHRALLSGSATSYTDTSLDSNNEHFWRVRAEGPGGVSGWRSGGRLSTAPAAPSGAAARKAEQGVLVSWTDNAAPVNRERFFVIEDSPGGGSWRKVGEIGGSATSWTHTDADPAVTHRYRVWAEVRYSSLTLRSGGAAMTDTLQLQAAPKQPARVGPSDSSTFEVGDTLTLQWEHLPVDTTAQTEAEVNWRVAGGDWNTVAITGEQDTYEVTPNPSGARAQVEWRVRTRGSHPDWSPWSTTNGPLLSTRPQVLLQSPAHGEDLTTSRVEASWTFDPGGDEAQLRQTEWTLILSQYLSGTTIENLGGSEGTAAELQTRLDNRTEYALQLVARNGDGLWSASSLSVFVTDFPLPAVVEAFPAWDQASGAVSVGFGESQELRASYRWTGEPGASTSEQYVEDPALAVEHTQMVPNGDLSDGDTAWDNTAADWERVAVNGPPGAGLGWALRATSTGRPYSGPAMPVATGHEYIFEVWLRADLPDSSAYIELRDPDDSSLAVQEGTIESGGTGSVASYLMSNYTVPTTWTLYRLRFTPKADVGSVIFQGIYVNHANGTEREAQVWWTGFKLYPASAIDGGVTATNLALDPANTRADSWESVRELTTVDLTDGGWSGNVNGTATQMTGTEGTTAHAETARGERISCTPGQTFTAGLNVAVPAGFGASVRLYWYGASGYLSNESTFYVPDSGDGLSFSRITLTGAAPAEATNVGMSVWLMNADGGSTGIGGVSVLMEALTIEHGSTDGAYFDGSAVGVTDVDAIDVERRQPDGSWLLIASGISTSTTVTDRTPHIGDVDYRAISRTVLPTEQAGPPSTATWVHDRDPVFVNGSEGMDQLCLARGNEATDEHSVDQALHRFAGQAKPTAFFGPGQDYATSFTGRILPHYHLPTSSRAEWVELLRQRGLVCFRDCTGRKLFGVLTVDFAQTGNVETVNIGVQEADYTEGVRRVSDYELEQRQGA